MLLSGKNVQNILILEQINKQYNNKGEGTMRKIAVEEHFENEMFRQFDRDAMAGNPFPATADAQRAQYLKDLFDAPVTEHRIPVMDKYDIAVQIISPNTQAVQYLHDSSQAVMMAMKVNDMTEGFVNQAPERFRGLALLPMQDPQAAAKELERCINEKKFVGGFVHGQTGLGDYPYYDDGCYDVLWKKMEELDVPLYIHPRSPEPDQIKAFDGCDELLGNTWDWGFVTGTLVLRMVFNGVFERFPNLKVAIGHMGETIPYCLKRLDEGYECRRLWEQGKITNPPSFYLKRNLYIAASGGYRPETMACAIEALGLDKILFGTDYPHFPTEMAVDQLGQCRLNKGELEAICYKNAERLFKL